MWKTLKKICQNKSHSVPKEIQFGNEVIENELNIAEKFNEYFVGSINDIIESIPKQNGYELDIIEVKNKLTEFKPIEMHSLRKIIYDLPNKSGIDGISTRIIKTAFEVIGNRFLDVINSSLQKGICPNNWKISVVTPIPKILNTIICEEFRPVNTLPVYEKTLELVVKEQLIKHCMDNDILIENQSGFRESHSCETALQFIISDWVKTISKNQIIVAVFLDFKRAFETVNRKLLLSKLEKMGIRGTVLVWIESYLTGRRQKTRYINSASNVMDNDFGVPQGSVLGPLLFVLFINDIVKSIKNCKVHLFADDTLIYLYGENINDVINAVNQDLKDIFFWLCDNSLKVNIDKCKYMILGKKHVLSRLQMGDSIVLNNKKLEKVSEIKYLGFIIDESLTFKCNSDYIIKKVAKKIYFLRRISNYLSMFSRILVYKTIIAPHFEYCATLQLYLNNNDIQKLQKMQNKAMRIILKCNRYTPIDTMLNVLNFLNVRQRIVLKALQFIFKIKHGMAPRYLCDKLSFVRDTHGYNTRSVNDMVVERYDNLMESKSLFCKGIQLFNSLPKEIKYCEKYTIFIKLCVSYIKKEF